MGAGAGLEAAETAIGAGLLKLGGAVLNRASRGWRGLTKTADGLRLLQDLRRSLLEPPPPAPATHRHRQRDNDRPENVGATA